MMNKGIEKIIQPASGDIDRKEGTVYEKMKPQYQRITDQAKEKLVGKLKFGIRPFDDLDQDVIDDLNRHFLDNAGYMSTQVAIWENALMDINKDAADQEDTLAKNFATAMYAYLTKESKLRNRFNN